MRLDLTIRFIEQPRLQPLFARGTLPGIVIPNLINSRLMVPITIKLIIGFHRPLRTPKTLIDHSQDTYKISYAHLRQDLYYQLLSNVIPIGHIPVVGNPL